MRVLSKLSFSAVQTLAPLKAGGVIALASLALTGCQQGATGLTGNQVGQRPLPAQAQQKQLSPTVVGEQVGSGPVRLALLVPTGAQGSAGVIGQQLVNAAKLAVRDFGANRIQIVIKDTKGKGADVSLAASQARDEGASLIIGPLFSANVSAAAGITQPANIPMLAFTSDVNRAGNGTYMMSFVPDNDVRSTLSYGLTQSANRVVALLPKGAYGNIADREMRRVLEGNAGQVVSVARYDATFEGRTVAARAVALAIENANGIYIPEGGEAPVQLLTALRKAGVSLNGKLVMGSGQWDSIKKTSSVLQGAVYSSADKTNFETFAQRYSTAYGQQPIVNAGLAYDAISLAAELVRRNPRAPFTAGAIQSQSGFSGSTGVFRFEPSGRIQRGLAINKISNGSVVVVSPAPRNFAAQLRR